ncbi:MAG: hypothetical protein ACREM3_24750 [Candidatus Rokuibacteriota bacterium]
MSTLTIGTALVAALLLAISPALAQPQSPTTNKADCPPDPSASPGAAAPAPEKLEGTVTDVDRANNTVSLRTQDGRMHQFRGNPETIKDLKAGDRLELNKRAAARNC